MPPNTTPEEAEAHLALLDELNMHDVPKPFKNPNWKPSSRRNKTVKTILAEMSRKEASLLPTQENSGAATPNVDESSTSTDGESTAVSTPAAMPQPNLAQASKSLSKMVLEKNMKANESSSTPSATYTNIEAPPTLGHPKKYCDITGLPAPYTDPKTRLRYHNAEVFAVVRNLGPGVAEQYLEARGAHTVLK